MVNYGRRLSQSLRYEYITSLASLSSTSIKRKTRGQYRIGSEAATREEDGSEQVEDTLKEEPGEQDLCLESIQLCSTSGPHLT